MTAIASGVLGLWMLALSALLARLADDVDQLRRELLWRENHPPAKDPRDTLRT